MTLSFTNLTFSRNDISLFKQVNCMLKSGELLQIRGANGCGKSTLLRIIAGYIEPETGLILWQNQPITAHLQQIFYLGHQNGLKPYLTVKENLKLSAALMNQSVSVSQIDNVLHAMELQHATHKQVVHLSAGQQRRLALARLQLTAAKLWILDEPTTALDTTGQALFNALLDQHLIKGGLAMVATHHDFTLDCPIKTLHLDNHA